MTELLSPAGSPEALRAAVQSGADAVYLGLDGFNARRSARNFTAQDLADAVSYCHLRGVRVYLTLNTLLTDRELPAALESLTLADASGVDAVLIQDWGLLSAARQILPQLPLHASTQMSLFTLGGARMARRLGMERVVLARELSRDEIAAICRDCSVEVEVFVHGALCMCYSGQCAMSAVIGRRSGNRGACAQPCRLPYGVNGPCTGDRHPLSLKDLNLSDHLSELSAMGVACLKIEGRMKRPEYVALVTSVYRRLLDEGRAPTPQERRQLAQAFSRDGFTDGYYLGKKDASLFGSRPESARAPEGLFASVRHTYETGEHRLQSVSLQVSLHRAEPAVLTAVVRRGGAVYTASASGPVPEPAAHRALTEPELAARLSKTGGTVFTVSSVDVSLDEGLALSAAAVNALRRSVLEDLTRQLSAPPRSRSGHAVRPLSPLPPAPAAPSSPLLTCSVADPRQLTESLCAGVEAVYLPLERLDEADLTPFARCTKLFAVLPRVFRTEDEPRLRAILSRHGELHGAVLGNLGHFPVVEGLPLELRGDFSLNVTNARSLLFLSQLGLSAATLSFELRHQQLRDVPKYLPCEAVVYGRLPLMITEACPIGASGQCSHGAGGTLTDRTGACFPTLCAYGCRCEIQNSLPLYLADKPDYRACGLTYARLRFTTETAAECLSVLRLYQGAPGEAPAAFTRGLFYRGVE
ncbi:MAG: U32 family peptidase [Oscillospiraceae bacterium]|nr:U32 family peptidase [Oscillospiraceae bacterium]